MKRYGRNDQFFSLVFHDLKNFNFFKCKFSLRIYVRFQFRGGVFLRNRNEIFASNCFTPFLPGQPKFRSKHARSSLESRHGSAAIGLYNCHPFVSRPLTRPRVISRVISPSVRTLSPGILVNKIVQFNSAKGIIRESLIKTRKPVLRHNFPRIYHTFPLDFDFSKSQYR